MLYGKKYGGKDPQLIEGDSFRMIISVPEFSENPAKAARIVPSEHVTPEVTPEVNRMLTVLMGEMTRTELMIALELNNEKHFRQNYQQVSIAQGLLEMTIPGKPNSRLQKYRLTSKGQALLASLRSK